jgi:hypothetical protein
MRRIWRIPEGISPSRLPQLRRFGGDAFDDRARRLDRVDEAGGFAEPDGRIVGVTVGECL